MMHCSECNAPLKRRESVCWHCKAKLGSQNAKGAKRFCKAVNFIFLVFTVLTVLSLFTDITPAFKVCAAALLIVHLVKSSADEMAELGSMSAFRVAMKRTNRKWREASVPQWQLALEKRAS